MAKNKKKNQKIDSDVFMQISSEESPTTYMLKVPVQYKSILDNLMEEQSGQGNYHNSKQMLQFFCELFEELDHDGRSNFEVLLNSGIKKCETISDLVKMILQMHKYYRLKGVDNREKLGRFHIIAKGYYELVDSLSKDAFDNATEIGRQIKDNEGGKFFGGDYIGRHPFFLDN